VSEEEPRSGLRDPVRAVRGVAAGTLVLEAITVLFALAPVATLGGGLTGPRLAALLGIVALLLVCAGLLRRPWAYWLATGAQVLVIASGFLTPAMFVLGVIFGAIWVYALRLRATITPPEARG
jgi:hypothetical protein